ncbi:unnamed protein product [Brugia pahangi]|uniref:Uncharacterized protein n=1 Tax=Brugia pahangi TaxID=6280 RepID=A0A0N4T1Y1_BRUPA|nr:unnamed protein product [Brugia pahangi]
MKNRWNVLYCGGYVFRQLGTTNHLQKYIIVTAVLFVHRYAIMSHWEPRDDEEEEEEENNICPRQKIGRRISAVGYNRSLLVIAHLSLGKVLRPCVEQLFSQSDDQNEVTKQAGAAAQCQLFIGCGPNPSIRVGFPGRRGVFTSSQ